MSHHVHLRVTPPTAAYDLSGALAHAEKYCVYREVGSETNKEHMHIYIETDACESTIKSDIRRGFHIPMGQKGKNSAYFCCKYDKYKDPSPEYVAKDGICVASKGFSQLYLDECTIKGKAKYKDKVSEYLTPVSQKEPTKEKVSEFERLLMKYEKEPTRRDKSMAQIATWIKSDYLCRKQCIPRTGDIARYAYSLYAIVRGNYQEKDIHLNETEYESSFGKPL